METRGRLPSPKPGRDQHVSTEARLWQSTQKQTIRESTNRSSTEMQTTQSLHASWPAKIQMELRDKAVAGNVQTVAWVCDPGSLTSGRLRRSRLQISPFARICDWLYNLPGIRKR